MKTNYNRDWLQNYRTNPKTDTAIYKNYQNPSMTQWDQQMASLSPAQKGNYEKFINTIPDEVKGLSAIEMQRYMQNLNEKQQGLSKERAGYDTQIQNIKAQEQARIRAQQEAQRQAQLRTKEDRGSAFRTAIMNARFAPSQDRPSQQTAYLVTPTQFGQSFFNPSLFSQIGTPFQHSGTHPKYAGPYNIPGTNQKFYINQ
jgi:hypothetical protein